MGFYLLSFIFLLNSINVEAQTSNEDDSNGTVAGFRPSVAVVIGVLSIMFSFTFLLLMYAKFCHSSPSSLASQDPELHHHPHGLASARSRFSGIDTTIIESLPFFRFSSLKGSREGLECSVCLSKFEDTEVLRLLPKCKHAFHIDCVDRWLESHSSCPLCRYKVDAQDLTIFAYSNSLRFSRNPSDLREDPNLELFVRRETDHGVEDESRASSRFSIIGSSFRKVTDKAKKDEEDVLMIPLGSDDGEFLHKFKHRIIVSDVVFNNRWSDVTSSDLMFLNSEMINVMSSKRFSSLESNNGKEIEEKNGMSMNDEGIIKIREELEKKRALESKISIINKSISISGSGIPSTSDTNENSSSTSSNFLIPSQSGKRSMSEIVNLSRFAEFGSRKYRRRDANGAKDEKVRRLWLPIARRTVQWFAGRERRLQSQYARQSSNV